MFSAKQKQLMNILGIVSDYDRCITYDGYCEIACEMAAEGMNAGTFTDYLERKLQIAVFNAERNAKKSLRDLA